MKSIIICLFIFLSLSFVAMADLISAPPPMKDPTIFHYFREVYENFHRLEVVTTNPDGNRQGKIGDMLLLQTGGSNYLEINTNGTQTWRGVELTDLP